MLALGIAVMGLLAAGGCWLRGASLHEAFPRGCRGRGRRRPRRACRRGDDRTRPGGARDGRSRRDRAPALGGGDAWGSASVIATGQDGDAHPEPAPGRCDRAGAGGAASATVLEGRRSFASTARAGRTGKKELGIRGRSRSTARSSSRRASAACPDGRKLSRAPVAAQAAVRSGAETADDRLRGPSPPARSPSRGHSRRFSSARRWTSLSAIASRLWRTHGRQGLRVLAVAERTLQPGVRLDDRVDSSLTCVGIVALQDPLRPAAAEAVRAAHGAGIAVAMLTGDHPLTAASITGRSASASRSR